MRKVLECWGTAGYQFSSKSERSSFGSITWSISLCYGSGWIVKILMAKDALPSWTSLVPKGGVPNFSRLGGDSGITKIHWRILPMDPEWIFKLKIFWDILPGQEWSIQNFIKIGPSIKKLLAFDLVTDTQTHRHTDTHFCSHIRAEFFFYYLILIPSLLTSWPRFARSLRSQGIIS